MKLKSLLLILIFISISLNGYSSIFSDWPQCSHVRAKPENIHVWKTKDCLHLLLNWVSRNTAHWLYPCLKINNNQIQIIYEEAITADVGGERITGGWIELSFFKIPDDILIVIKNPQPHLNKNAEIKDNFPSEMRGFKPEKIIFEWNKHPASWKYKNFCPSKEVKE